MLTLVASPQCAMVTDEISGQRRPLPEAIQRRNYDARIMQRNGALEMVFTPAECHGGSFNERGSCEPLLEGDCRTTTYPNGGCATGSVEARDMHFYVTPAPATPLCGGGDYWWEEFAAGEVFEACGIGQTRVNDPVLIAGTFAGTFHYSKAANDQYPGHYWAVDQYCRASDHQFTLTKR